MLSAPVLMLSASGVVMTGACSSSGAGNTTGGAGSTGSGGSGNNPANLLSDFEDPVAATVVHAGTPERNGYWYSYNDNVPAGTDATCVQTPGNGVAYLPDTPATAHPGATGTMALHAVWTGCAVWGAGVGADLNQPAVDGGMYMGAKVPYDLTGYTGISFWAMSAPAGDNKLRIKVPMTDETKIVDGGGCDETDPAIGMNKCSDDWGQAFNLPTNGTWTQITVMFSDATKFKQEGWGHVFPWNPAHVTSIQIQSQGAETGQPYDFWIDDVYLIHP